MAFLGIDLGTSGLRALLVDEQGAPIGSAEASYRVSNPAPGWSEQDPNDWIIALETAISELKQNCSDFLGIKGIGVSGHMHGAVLLDHFGDVLRPCILWNDTRAAIEAAELDGVREFREISANIVFPGFTAAKLTWVRNNEPEVFRKTATVLLPAAFLNFYLTGEYVSDMSDSSGTSWLDVKNRTWSDQLLQMSHMSKAHMPRLVEGCQQAGQLRNELCAKWGLANDVIVCGGAGDNAAAACGIGVVSEGAGFVSLGTSGVVLLGRDRFSAAPENAVHTFCHAVPDHWYQMGVMLAATDSLNWLSRIVGMAPAKLTEELGEELRVPGTISFYPYLSGERTPHNDARIRGAFTGLNHGTSRQDLTRAVLEGVCFGLRDSLEALTVTATRPEVLTAVGGGSASTYWVKQLATILGVPLQLAKGREFGAALGAARLATIAVTKRSLSDVIVAPDMGTIVEPKASLQPEFEDKYQSFRDAFNGLKAIQ